MKNIIYCFVLIVAFPSFTHVPEVVRIAEERILHCAQHDDYQGVSHIIEERPGIIDWAFSTADYKLLSIIWAANPDFLYRYKSKIIGSLHRALANRAYYLGNPFDNDKLQAFFARHWDLLMAARDAKDFSERLTWAFLLSGYRMSHLQLLVKDFGKKSWRKRESGFAFAEFEGRNVVFATFSSFSEDNLSKIIPAVKMAQMHHADLVFDLRDNPGGKATVLKKSIGLFFDDDFIFGILADKPAMEKLYRDKNYYYEKKDFFNLALKDNLVISKNALKTVNNHSIPIFTGKIAILVNQNTASSGEVFSYILQKYRNASIIGTRTAGAVLMAIPICLSPCLTLSLPLGECVLADGESLEGNPVIPDYDLSQLPLDECLRRHFNQ